MHSRNIEVLDLNDNPPTWHKFAVTLPVRVAGHKCVVYGNRLLIIGGRTDEIIASDRIYELLLVPPYSCKLLCRMKKKRAFHGVELFDDKVLIAGGVDTEADVEIFDITRNECVEMPSLLYPRAAMATVPRDDCMLLIAGRDKGRNVCNEIIEHNFKTGQRKVLTEVENVGLTCSAVFCRNTLVVIRVSMEYICSVDCFNFLANSWKELPSMTNARACSAAVLVNNF